MKSTKLNLNYSWGDLWRELKKRTLQPLRHPSFVIYFVVAVIVVGGAGVWLELITYLQAVAAKRCPSLDALRTALVTFFPALAGCACLQLIWAEDHQRALRAFAILVLFAVSILALVLGLIPAIEHRTALFIGLFPSAIALWIWWVANAKQPDLLDPDAPTGGDPNGPLAGDLRGFKI